MPESVYMYIPCTITTSGVNQNVGNSYSPNKIRKILNNVRYYMICNRLLVSKNSTY